MKVTPRIGVGPLVFGMSRGVVKKKVGLPTYIEDLSSDIVETIAWHYEDLDCSLYFDLDADLRLTSIDASAASIELAGYRPIGMREAEAIRAYSAHWAVELDEDYKQLGLRQYELVGSDVWLWFQDGICNSVQVAVFIGKDDEYAWPLVLGG